MTDVTPEPVSILQRIDRADVEVMYLEVPDVIAEIQSGWPRFEAIIGNLRGRHFLATVHPELGTYRTSVERREGDDAAELGLLTWTVPGGTYLRKRLRGKPPTLYDGIGPAADLLERSAEWDRARPMIEVYKRHDLVDVLMPVVADTVTVS